MLRKQIGRYPGYKYPETAIQTKLSNHIQRGFLTSSCYTRAKFICPVCGAESSEPLDSNAYQCGTCGVMYQAFGNTLYLWGHPKVYQKALDELTRVYMGNARERIINRNERLKLEATKQTLLAEASNLKNKTLEAILDNYSNYGMSGTMDGADVLIARAKGKNKFPKPVMPEGMQGLIDHIDEWAKSDDPRELMLVGLNHGLISISKSK